MPLIISALLLLFLLYNFLKKRPPLMQPQENVEREILNKHVAFYQKLNDVEKKEFLERVQLFLSNVKITGIKTEVEDLDRVLIAAGAIIPIFHFKEWQYKNIHEVLLYPNLFSNEFNLESGGRNIMGEVGSGPLQNIMILSKPNLRAGFLQDNTTGNTAIHEFVHLIDKADGTTDGMPDYLLKHQYALPWLKYIHSEMKKIQSEQSDINPYACTNEAEFFAVVAEYFFKQPALMKERHPELFAMLEKMFLTTPEGSGEHKVFVATKTQRHKGAQRCFLTTEGSQRTQRVFNHFRRFGKYKTTENTEDSQRTQRVFNHFRRFGKYKTTENTEDSQRTQRFLNHRGTTVNTKSF